MPYGLGKGNTMTAEQFAQCFGFLKYFGTAVLFVVFIILAWMIAGSSERR
jgi:hypothetical protein